MVLVSSLSSSLQHDVQLVIYGSCTDYEAGDALIDMLQPGPDAASSRSILCIPDMATRNQQVTHGDFVLLCVYSLRFKHMCLFAANKKHICVVFFSLWVGEQTHNGWIPKCTHTSNTKKKGVFTFARFTSQL